MPPILLIEESGIGTILPFPEKKGNPAADTTVEDGPSYALECAYDRPRQNQETHR